MQAGNCPGGFRTLLLVLFTCVMQHTAVLLGNSSTLNKRGENPPRCNRTTPADFSLANPAVNAQTIFSFSAVMAFHEALTTRSKYPIKDVGASKCCRNRSAVPTRKSNSIAIFLTLFARCILSKPALYTMGVILKRIGSSGNRKELK